MLKLSFSVAAWTLAMLTCAQTAKFPLPVASHDALSAEVILYFRSDFAARQPRQGLIFKERLRSSIRGVVFRAASVAAAARAVREAQGDPSIEFAFQNAHVYLQKDFAPNDPYFLPNYPSSGWPGQWYLDDALSNLDIEAPIAWALGSGTGTIVGVVDDGVETTHPDLTANYNSANSYDFGQGDSNPSPVSIDDNHGTALAGIIAGRGGNATGITGVMATGKWAGLRLDFDNLTTAQLVDAALYHSSGIDTSIKIKNHSYGPIVPYADGAAESAALATSASFGTIHVRSAGNLRGTIAEDANKSMVRNSVNSITIAAINSNGRFADYSSFGACIFACAPSGGITAGLRPILTSDRFGGDAGFNKNGTADSDALGDGAYTSLFGTEFNGGTSVAAGLAAGTLGIAKGLNLNLDTRMAKHLIARTSRQIDAGDGSAEGDGWRTNGAGLKFNQNYGFGLLNAGAIAQQVTQWAGVSTLGTESLGPVAVGTSIPDNNASGVTRFFNLTSTDPLEEVLISLNITHAYRGDLEAYVTSPTGLKSRLFASNLGDDGDNVNWTFTTNAFWGESPAGQWTLQLADRGATDTGTWTNYTVVARTGRLVRNVEGTIHFGDISTNAPVPTLIELRNASTDALISTHNLNLSDGQTFRIETQATGTLKAVFITPNWLKKVSAASFNLGIASLGQISLVNGDADQSNEVDLTDIDQTINAYGTGGPSPHLGDLDWSGEVDLTDIDIAIAGYGLGGD